MSLQVCHVKQYSPEYIKIRYTCLNQCSQAQSILKEQNLEILPFKVSDFGVPREKP